jgi:hypothetical protein
VLRVLVGIVIGVLIGAAAVGGWWYFTDDSNADDASDERPLAEEYAAAVEEGAGPGYSLLSVERVATGVWRVTLNKTTTGANECYLIQLNRFTTGEPYQGLLPTRCDR